MILPRRPALALALALAGLGVLSAQIARADIAPASDFHVLASGTVAGPVADAVTWTGNRFAVVYESGEWPYRLAMRFVTPGAWTFSDEVEIAAAGGGPRVAAFADGSLVVAWMDENGVYARFVDASGEVLSDALTLADGGRADLRIAAGADGRWLVSFGVYDEEAEIWTVLVRRMDGAEPVDPEPIELVSHSYDADVALLADGRLLGAWTEIVAQEPEDYEEFPTQTWLLARTFTASGASAGEEQLPGADVHIDEQARGGFDVVADGSDGFAVAWVDELQSDYFEPGSLFVRALAADGSPSGAARLLGEFTADLASVSIAASPSSFAVGLGIYPGELEFNDVQGVHLVDVPRDGGSIRRIHFSREDGIADANPSIAMSPSGDGLAVWRHWPDNAPPSELTARAFVVRPILDCGDANYDGRRSTSDALAILRSAVGLRYCAAAICDTNGDGNTTATDARVALEAAVGLVATFDCPAAPYRA
jgi:hypothetical protein